ncbi:Tyrosinase [Pleurostoma richardsiae]|uniref:Tyrosinase n=1 Tax=Pleurostoma richardsiae TaxID=41990 RepID=A0AA38RS44_9PEZI|nr:Tyrosinase [Pleurostoma richardsiae]
MLFLNTLALFLVALVEASLAACKCSKPSIRKEWRALSSKEKASYISAVQCLQSKPGTMQHLFDGVRSRFDDFQGLHINLTTLYHFTGPFHPWHRVFLNQYEADLRRLCGYTGAQPYWDWTQDATSEAAFLAAPVFETSAFGANGPYINTSEYETTNVPVKIPYKTGGGCVSAGSFVNMSVNLGPGASLAYNPRCLQRDFSPWLATRTLNSSVESWTLSSDSFALFDHRVQGLSVEVSGMTYHAGGHMSVGGDIGEIGNMYSSPGDPLFYLHHANLDRLWDKWQRQNWPTRAYDIAGPDTMWAYPFNFFGDVPYTNITLNTQLDFWELLTSGQRYVKIADVMDIRNGSFCYDYA